MGELSIINADLSQAQHAVDFVELLDTYARDPMGGGQPLSADVRARLVEAARNEVGFGALLAYQDGAAAGLLTHVRGFSTFSAAPLLSIHDIVVSEAFRRRGIGQALLVACEKKARDMGCCKLTLEVLSGNEVAKAAYLKFGFDGYTLDPEHGSALFWQKKF